MLRIGNCIYHNCISMPEDCEIYLEDGFEFYALNSESVVNLDIKFCPYCGEELKAEV